MSALPEWELYARELMPRKHGYPLWGPEPSPEDGETRLGDVGYLRKGRFWFLFNCLRPATHPVNSRRGVPLGFTVFVPPDGRGADSGQFVHDAIEPPHVLSANCQSFSIGAAVGYVNLLFPVRFTSAHAYPTYSGLKLHLLLH